MVTALRTDEISSEMLMKTFLKEVFSDDAIATLIAHRLAEKGTEERSRIVSSLSVSTNTHRSRWDSLVGKIK